jgi:hypothetical protein
MAEKGCRGQILEWHRFLEINACDTDSSILADVAFVLA